MNSRRLLCVTVLAVASAPLPALAAGALDPLDRHLEAYCADVVAKAIAGGEPKVVAVLPFADDLRGIRRLGVVAAEKLQTRLINLPGVKVSERQNLDKVMKEKKAWLSDFFEDSDPARRAEAAKILKADYLVLGTLSPTKTEIIFTLRLVEAASGRNVPGTGKEFSIPYAAELEDLVEEYVQPPEQAAGRRLRMPPIELAVSVVAQMRQADGGVKETPVKDGDALKSGDQFQIQFTPVADCWVYVFLVGSSGKCETLFPYKGIKLGNFARGGAAYTIPDPDLAGGSRWFFLDNVPGVETIYVVASYDEMKDIGTILAEMNRSGGDAAASAAARERLLGAIDDVRDHPEGPAGAATKVNVRPEPPSAPTADVTGQILRGRFQCVKELRLIHR